MIPAFAHEVLVYLEDASSNDNTYCSGNSNVCANRPIIITQDESISSSWLSNSPYACADMYYSGGGDTTWTAWLYTGYSRIYKIEVLSWNTSTGYTSGVTVEASGT